MIDHNEKTIVAHCTPKGTGAIALIRISGLDAISIASKISKLSNNKLHDVESHTIHYGQVIDRNENIIDQVMFIVMKAPRTFTGEDTVEITCHNNIFIIEQIISLIIENGARLAQQGEFAKRAFLNGKIDITQAEAINDLLGANTQQALKKSLSQLQGSLTNWVYQIEQKLLKCLALSDASFEFLDDEIEFGSQILQEINNINEDIKLNKQNFNLQQQIKEGIRIAIIGSVNAGKSSLFNKLLKKDRAIVSDIAGTTRDVIESGIIKNNLNITLIDTAGLRQTKDVIERFGIEKSFQEAQKADIILLAFDGLVEISNQEKKVFDDLINLFFSKIIAITTKSDLQKSNKSQLNITNHFPAIKNVISISTKTNENIDLLEKEIQIKSDLLLEKLDSPFLLNKRQYNLLMDLENKLNEIILMLNKTIEYEILSIHINEALQSICELTGKSISESSMDMIFKEFCVGK